MGTFADVLFSGDELRQTIMNLIETSAPGKSQELYEEACQDALEVVKDIDLQLDPERYLAYINKRAHEYEAKYGSLPTGCYMPPPAP